MAMREASFALDPSRKSGASVAKADPSDAVVALAGSIIQEDSTS